MIKKIQTILFHLIWGKEERFNNTKFDNWRGGVVKNIITNDSTILKPYRSFKNKFIKDHWIGKPMRSEYHSLIHFYRLAQTYIKSFNLINDDSNILDVGCASGLFLMLWANKKKQGIDLLNNCSKYGSKNGLHILQGDAENLPYFDNEFEVVFLLEIIEHVQNPFKVMQEAKRVCSDKIICTFPAFKKTSIKPFDIKQYFENDSHFLEVKNKDFINMLTHLRIKGFKYEVIDIWNGLSFFQKTLSFAIGFQWPKWHMYIIEK